jgi:hypothetical protein
LSASGGFRGSTAPIILGDLRNSITVVKEQGGAFVGMLRTIEGKSGQPLVNADDSAKALKECFEHNPRLGHDPLGLVSTDRGAGRAKPNHQANRIKDP